MAIASFSTWGIAQLLVLVLPFHHSSVGLKQAITYGYRSNHPQSQLLREEFSWVRVRGFIIQVEKLVWASTLAQFCCERRLVLVKESSHMCFSLSLSRGKSLNL